MAESTTHGYPKTLHEDGYPTKEGDEYDIGMRFLRLGEYSRTKETAYELAAEEVTQLAEETSERAQFVVEETGEGVFVYRESGPSAVETGSGTGKRV
jgi:DNA-binding IclR family transcriptional regulator